ncbi:hypothetical protein [Thalassobaculum sp.]|uniref:hypothetical protein n=1 Tax=Thalassobaculum sp. TaxID=2022740 RepID=UPI0032EAF37C
MTAYYTVANPPSRNTLGRAAPIADELQAIQDGFALIPEEGVLKRGRVQYASAVGGTANAITLTMPFTVTAYTEGDCVRFKVAATNTAAVTVDVDGVGPAAIKRPNGDALIAGDLIAGAMVELRCDGSVWQAVGYTGADITAAAASAAAAAASASTASTQASTATTQAGISTAQAVIATTKAGEAAASAIDAAAAVNGVKVSVDDTTPGDLETKMLAGDGITRSTQNDGGNETVTFALTKNFAVTIATAYALTL